MTIGGVSLTCHSQDDETLKYIIAGVSSHKLENIQLYLEDGLPKGYKHEVEEISLSIEAKFYGVSPTTGSAGGTKIILKVSGGFE